MNWLDNWCRILDTNFTAHESKVGRDQLSMFLDSDSKLRENFSVTALGFGEDNPDLNVTFFTGCEFYCIELKWPKEGIEVQCYQGGQTVGTYTVSITYMAIRNVRFPAISLTLFLIVLFVFRDHRARSIHRRWSLPHWRSFNNTIHTHKNNNWIDPKYY